MPAQADQRVAVAQGVVDKRKRMVLGQGLEPERELGQADGEGVAVDAVEAALGDEAAGVELDGLVDRDFLGGLVVVGPGLDQRLRQVTAGGHQEGAGAHRRVADLEPEDLLGARPLAEGGEHRPQGGVDDRLGQGARGVVRARAAALLGRLEVERAGGERGRGLRREP